MNWRLDIKTSHDFLDFGERAEHERREQVQVRRRAAVSASSRPAVLCFYHYPKRKGPIKFYEKGQAVASGRRARETSKHREGR